MQVGSVFTNKDGIAVVEPVKAKSAGDTMELNDVTAWMDYANHNDDIFGEDTAHMMHDSGNVKANDNSKISAFARFIQAISDHPHFSKLACLVPDPDGGMVMRFLLLVRGSSNVLKMHLLNVLFLTWCRVFHFPNLTGDKSAAELTYQPNYTDKHCRQIFTCLHVAGVTINHSHFSNFIGSYWAFQKGKFAVAVAVRPDFGKNPFRAAVEYDDEIKMRTMAEPPYRLEEDFRDNFYVMTYKVSRDLLNRGGNEVSQNC
jgi:hypothetical protein